MSSSLFHPCLSPTHSLYLYLSTCFFYTPALLSYFVLWCFISSEWPFFSSSLWLTVDAPSIGPLTSQIKPLKIFSHSDMTSGNGDHDILEWTFFNPTYFLQSKIKSVKQKDHGKIIWELKKGKSILDLHGSSDLMTSCFFVFYVETRCETVFHMILSFVYWEKVEGVKLQVRSTVLTDF